MLQISFPIKRCLWKWSLYWISIMGQHIWSWLFYHQPIEVSHIELKCLCFIFSQDPNHHQYQEAMHRQSKKTFSNRLVSCESSVEQTASSKLNQLYIHFKESASQAVMYDNLFLVQYVYRSLLWNSMFVRYFTHFVHNHKGKRRSLKLLKPHWSWIRFWFRFSLSQVLSHSLQSRLL